MKNKKVYYNWDNLIATGATYLMALGARNIGKSYDIKIKVLRNAYKSDNKFGLVRRWKEDLKQDLVQQYFADMPIKDITHEEYNYIRCWQGKIYFGNLNDDGVWDRKKKLIGYCFALTSEQHFKSTMYPDLTDLIFEEFISNTFYLPDEPKKLTSLISTIARGRKIKVFLVANTISRMCPYFGYWSLDKTLQQKQGTIDTYDFTFTNDYDEQEIIKVAVEMCGIMSTNKMFFGKSQNMTVNGKWQSDEHPTLQYDRREYTEVYEMFVFKESLKFRCILLKKDTCFIWFVEPFTGKFKNIPNTRIIGDIYNESMLATTKLTPLSDKEGIAFTLVGLGKVAYSDNLTGTEFTKLLESL